MADGLVRHESPLEFFKEQVEGAMQRQHLRASDWTVYYLVNLLASFVVADTLAADARAGAAWRAAGPRPGRRRRPQREDLRQIADHALFLAGFFGDSLQRRLVDLDYYIALGGYAYSRLASHDDAFADVFGELAEKFVPVVDVLSDISDRSRSSTIATCCDSTSGGCERAARATASCWPKRASPRPVRAGFSRVGASFGGQRRELHG